jgi:hypothetical protein
MRRLASIKLAGEGAAEMHAVLYREDPAAFAQAAQALTEEIAHQA